MNASTMDPRVHAAYASLTAADDAIVNAEAALIAAYRDHAPTIEACRAKSGPLRGQLTRLAEVMHADGRSKSLAAAKVSIGRWAAIGRLIVANPDASDGVVRSLIVAGNALTGAEVDTLITSKAAFVPGMTGADVRGLLPNSKGSGKKSGKKSGKESGKKSSQESGKKSSQESGQESSQESGQESGQEDSRPLEGEEVTIDDALATFAEWALYLVDIAATMTTKEHRQFLEIMSATQKGVKENRKAA